MHKPAEGRARAVIENVQPQIDAGRFPAKAIAGDLVRVQADIFADGHDRCAARILYRPHAARKWLDAPMQLADNDRWAGQFPVPDPGAYSFTVEAWIDHALTWQAEMAKRLAPPPLSPNLDAFGATIAAAPAAAPDLALHLPDLAVHLPDLALHLEEGSILAAAAARRAKAADARALTAIAKELRALADSSPTPDSLDKIRGAALSPELTRLFLAWPDRRHSTKFAPELTLIAERTRARFSAWYEMFPRSTSVTASAQIPAAPAHGTFRTAEQLLPYVASMGFDVLYLPPVSPIGFQFRKGANNTSPAQPGEPGSPWAIGNSAGGHASIHPDLGTLDDFRHFLAAARAHSLELALDIAFQCSPDHPWVAEHPAFFKHRPDGSIQYAENPPKKYQDIYPLDFESAEWRALWDELLNIFLFWANEGVRIFRVDNPHTKSFAFWQWCIAQVKEQFPDSIFLAEAFTRPKVMYRLAKLGFTQSYTYFTWRNTAADLRAYLEELTGPHAVFDSANIPRNFFRPSLWPNTPDILHEQLQIGGRAAFTSRLVLAATLSAGYGIYGPPFELQESTPLRKGSEEYLHSEKYEVRDWSAALANPNSLRPLIARINAIRNANPALQANDTLLFHEIDNPNLLCYSKIAEPPAPRSSGNSAPLAANPAAPEPNRILVVVNLDPANPQAGSTALNLAALALDWTRPYSAEDLLTGAFDAPNPPDLATTFASLASSDSPNAVYTWRDQHNYVALAPGRAHILRLTQPVK